MGKKGNISENCGSDCTEGKSWRMKKFGGLTSLDVKKEGDKKWGRRVRFAKIVVQNSCQKWVGFNMSGVADVKSWKI